MKFTVSVTGRVGAPAVVVYDTIADYRHAHPQILPRQFSDLRVVDGGVGAGTVITFRAHLLGMTQFYKGTVTEPEPGRVIVETYTEPAPSVTTFIVNDAGAASDVTITTDFETGRSRARRADRALPRRAARTADVPRGAPEPRDGRARPIEPPHGPQRAQRRRPLVRSTNREDRGTPGSDWVRLRALRVLRGFGSGRRERCSLGAACRHSSRCTVSGEKAGTQTAMYSAPSAPGVL